MDTVQRSDLLQRAFQKVLATSVTHSGDRAKSEAQNQAAARSGSEDRERVLTDGIVKPFQTGHSFPEQVGLGMGRSRASPFSFHTLCIRSIISSLVQPVGLHCGG